MNHPYDEYEYSVEYWHYPKKWVEDQDNPTEYNKTYYTDSLARAVNRFHSIIKNKQCQPDVPLQLLQGDFQVMSYKNGQMYYSPTLGPEWLEWIRRKEILKQIA